MVDSENIGRHTEVQLLRAEGIRQARGALIVAETLVSIKSKQRSAFPLTYFIARLLEINEKLFAVMEMHATNR